MLKKLCVLASALSIVVATPARAQLLPSFEFEPYGGAYLPLTDVVDQSVLVPGSGTLDISGGQKEALALGGRLTWWVIGPLGVEGNFMYAFSDLEETEAGVTSDTSAYVWAADARLAFRFGIPLSPVSFHVNGGIALIKRGGDAYTEVTDGDSNIGGVVGAGLKVKLPGILALRADAGTYLYSSKLTVRDPDTGATITFDSQFQADVVVSLGLVFGVGL